MLRMRRVAALLVFVSGALALYAVALKGMFIFDDYEVIVHNEFVRHVWPLTYLWEYDPSRFLPNVTFALNFHWSGLEPLAYRMVNVILHGVNAWLVLCLLSALDLFPRREGWRWSGAFCAALIFMAHPLQTQSVSYIVQRSTLMAAAMFLLAVLAFVKFSRAQSRSPRLAWYGASLLAALAGAFCKPNIIALPFVLFFVQRCVLDRDSGSKRWAQSVFILPFLAVVGLTVWNLWILKAGGVGITAVAGITRQTTEFSRMQYFSTQVNVIMQYVFMLVLPFWQNLDYDVPLNDHLLTFPSWISVIALIAMVVFAVRWRRRHRVVSFGIVWFLLTLMPESSVFPLSDVIVEHRLYLPLIGFALVLAAGLESLPSQKLKTAFVVILVAGLSGLTVSRNMLWAQPQLLLEDTVRKSPLKLRPMYNLESVYRAQERYEEAWEVLEKAMALGPDFPPTHYKMGVLLLQMGQAGKAYQHFDLGVRAEHPLIASESAWYAGILASAAGRPDEAEAFFLLSIEKDPRQEKALIDLGNLYNLQKKYAQAKERYARAIHTAPLNPNGYNGLASVLVMEGDVASALEIYDKALGVMPRNALIRMNLAKTHLIGKDYKAAAEAFSSMSSQDPQNWEAVYHYGLSCFYMGDHEKARPAFERAVRLLKEKGMDAQAAQIVQAFLTL